jgi:hypothetical protein
MAQENDGENVNDHNQGENKQPEVKPIWSTTNTAVAIQIFLLCLLFLWIFIPDYVSPADSAKVFIESMFSLAIVDVVVVHAIMYFKQAKEANNQVQISTTSLVVSNQAYVGIYSIADRQSEQGDIILIKLENVGRTPADEIRVIGHLNGLLLDRREISADVRPEFGYDFNEHFGRTKLLPGKLKVEMVLPYEKYATDSERKLIQKGYLALYVWGKIIYRDGFGDGKETEFSFFHSKTGRWLVAAPWSPNVIEMLESKTRSKPIKRKTQQS